MSSRVRPLSIALFGLVVSCLMSVPARPVTIDWVTVGDPGNDPDPATGSLYGAVNYEYKIGKYDVTIGQYTEFLNAVATSDPYSLYNTGMASDLSMAGISRSGESGSYTYSVMSNGGYSGNRPITFVTWFTAARFANWMQNGQGNGSTETGAYTLNGAMSGNAVTVNPGAQFYIPTENEWYKAAYYSPTLNSGAGGYYAYATQSDSAPGNVVGGGENQANYYTGAGYSVTQSSSHSFEQHYTSDVGAFTNSPSYYGTFDQSGNVYQWNDLDGTVGSSRGARGGSWDTYASSLSSSNRDTQLAVAYGRDLGFRLAAPAAVPESSTYAMALAGLACGGFTMWRRRRGCHAGSRAVA